MIARISWSICVLVFSEVLSVTGRHYDADMMLPNERVSLDDCGSRFHVLISRPASSPASGFPALVKEFAHMGAIGWTQSDGSVLWHCGGTLIWVDYVLTAAHCIVDHRNVRPDVVRFGDLNLESDNDNEYAQQLKITEIHRHPLHRIGAKYHDIALMKLERPVRIHDTVCPACLWSNEEIRFTELVATGWGSTGYFKPHTPALLKVSLKPMKTEQCEAFYTKELVRGLHSGLHENHLCAFDEKMDTCQGDSGGPLQIKLLHHHQLTPFVVAVTSFGLPCGQSKPGVYTKIAPYQDWILATLRNSSVLIEDNIFNATFCTLRYKRFREDFYSSPLNQTYVYVDHSKQKHFNVDEPPSYLAKLMWTGSKNDGPHHCYGVIIDENTVLTVADCIQYKGVPVSYISHPAEMINVSKIHVHPRYVSGSGYNNIAILRLEKMLSFIDIRPTCIESSKREPDTVFGAGRRDLYYCNQFPDCIDPSPISLKVYVEIKNATSCLIPSDFRSRFQDGITNDLICAGIDHFLVPGACELKLGSSISKFYYNYFYPKLDGLVQIGRDCGYGEHLIATRVQSHLKWMKRVLLPKPDGADSVQFLNSDHREGDFCEDEYGLPGHCVSISRCQRKWKKYGLTRLANFCSSSSVICCPNEEIDKDDWDGKHTMLEKCSKLVKRLLPYRSYGPMVKIVDYSSQYLCMGAIVTDKTILTSASCLGTRTSITVNLGGDEFEPIHHIEKIIKHYAYNTTDYSNDIALLRLTESLHWSPHLYPFCLWTNRTHSPLIVERLHLFDNIIYFKEVLTMYNSDCQRTHLHKVRDSHICVKYPYTKFTCHPSHSILRWYDGDGVPYIVGLSTDTRECEDWYYMTYSRTSAFVGWIVDNIDEDEMRRSFQ